MTPLRLSALLLATGLSAALTAGCEGGQKPTTPVPPEQGKPYLANGACFARDRAGRPVRISPEKCKGLEPAN